MLLDRNLGNMVHLVVNLNTNLVDNRSGSNSNWGSMSNSNGSSMSNSNRGSSMNSSNRSSMYSSSKRGSVSYSKRSCSNCRCRGIDSTVDTTKKATSNDLSISISSRCSKATGNNSRENSKEFHIDCVE